MLRTLPGVAVSARRVARRRRRQLRALLGERERGRAVPVRRRRSGDAHRRSTTARRSCGTCTCPAFACRGALRLSRPRRLRPAARAALQSRTWCCSIRTPRRPTASSAGSAAASPTRSAASERSRRRPTSRPARRAARRRGRSRRSTGRATRRPRTPLHRSVIYETHVRGLTMLHPEVPEALRGTYAGVAHPAVIRHLKELGVTAVELMPVHAFVDDKHLLDRGLRNYWGYSTIGFFAPDVALPQRRRCSAPRCASSRAWSRRCTAPASRSSSTWSTTTPPRATTSARRSASRASTTPSTTGWSPNDPRYYFDYTGTGNTLNVRHPQVLALIMDSLRYWASEMHVDGFRFDLASSLARQLHEVDRLSSFFTLIHQAPSLRHAKIIAEPWDVGDGRLPGRQLPRALGGVERPLPRRRARAVARRRRPRRARSATGSPAAATCTSSSGRRPSASINLDHRARRLHAARPGHLRAQAQRGQRRGQPRRQRRRARRGTAASKGPTDDSDDQRAAAPPAAQPAGDAAALAGHADAARRRRVRPHAARQQQRVLPGQRDLLVRLELVATSSARLFEFVKRLLRLRRDAPGAASRATSSRAAASWAPACTTSAGCATTARPCRTTTGTTRPRAASACSWRVAASTTSTRRAGRWSTTTC